MSLKELLKIFFDYDEKRKGLMETLDSKGDGEITIGKMAYPDTNLQIKHMKKKLMESTKGTFFADNNYLHFEQYKKNKR